MHLISMQQSQFLLTKFLEKLRTKLGKFVNTSVFTEINARQKGTLLFLLTWFFLFLENPYQQEALQGSFRLFISFKSSLFRSHLVDNLFCFINLYTIWPGLNEISFWIVTRVYCNWDIPIRLLLTCLPT